MTLPEAILFDMDGTIVDTEPLWEGADGQVLAEMGTHAPKDVGVYFAADGGNFAFICPQSS